MLQEVALRTESAIVPLFARKLPFRAGLSGHETSNAVERDSMPRLRGRAVALRLEGRLTKRGFLDHGSVLFVASFMAALFNVKNEKDQD